MNKINILLVDNYDSFVFNLKQYFEEEGCEVLVIRNDDERLKTLTGYDALVLSPGPGVPQNAGFLNETIALAYKNKPILGVCLGMQAIGAFFGGQLELLEKPFHGFATPITHTDNSIFDQIESPFNAGRYHSWVLNKASLVPEFTIIAEDEKGIVMGIKHLNFPIFGVQFHPESVLTSDGRQIIKNFVKLIENEIDK